MKSLPGTGCFALPNFSDLNLDTLLDALAERVATKLAARTGNGSDSAAVKPRLLNIDQAATYLGRTRTAVQHLSAEGHLPKVRLDSRVFFDVRDLDRLIDSSKD